MKYGKFAFLILLSLFLCSCETLERQSCNSANIRLVHPSADKKRIFHGYVKSQKTSQLSFLTEGKIIFLPYTKGDWVKKGQVIARLDGVMYKIREKEARAQYKEAQIKYNKSKSYYKRMDVLHKNGAISDNDWEDAYFDYKTNLEQVAIQKEKLNYLDEELLHNMIRAPYDGFIVEKISEVGSYAKIGEPVIVISGTTSTQVLIVVNSSVVNNLCKGMDVIVDCMGKKFEGKISHISKSSLTDGGYMVKVEFEGIYRELKDGMTADVEINFKNSKLAYIPLDSVLKDDSGTYVYKVNVSGDVEKEKIQTGEISGDKVEVISGVFADDTILAGEISKIDPNKKIKI